MKQHTNSENPDMQRIVLASLRELDCLYHTGTLDVYEQTWQHVEGIIQHLFPGFTIAYAELATAGSDRTAHGGMRHVLVPTERNAVR